MGIKKDHIKRHMVFSMQLLMCESQFQNQLQEQFSVSLNLSSTTEPIQTEIFFSPYSHFKVSFFLALK